jgi:hypothetical protein
MKNLWIEELRLGFGQGCSGGGRIRRHERLEFVGRILPASTHAG